MHSITMLRFPLYRVLAEWLTRINPPDWVLIMCAGYSEEDPEDIYSELYPEDDWDLDFDDAERYPDFQLWISLPLLSIWARKLFLPRRFKRIPMRRCK